MPAVDSDVRLDDLLERPQPAAADDLAAVMLARIPRVDRRWMLLALAAVFSALVVVWRGCAAIPEQVPVRTAVVSMPQQTLLPPVPGAVGSSPPAPIAKPHARVGHRRAAHRQTAARIDLNAANLAQIDSLPGVGPVIAQRILSWRSAHRGFSDVHELLEVKGIGPAKFKRLQPLVRIH